MGDYDLIRRAVEDAMKEQMKNFYIEREKHYKHHEFIDEWMEWTKETKSTCIKALMTIVIGGLVALLAVGFAVKVGGQIR